MSFPVSLLGPPSPRIPSPRTRRSLHIEDSDSSSSTESIETARSHSRSRPRIPFPASNSSSGPNFLLPPTGSSGRSSVSSTATSTPLPSRSESPLPHFFSSAPSSTCTSDTESEPSSPLLGTRPRSPWWREERRRWWMFRTGARSRSRRKRHGGCWRIIKKGIRRLLRHPFFPRQPITIVLTLLLLTIFAIVITLLLIHILNPDKEPLPWRAYCSVPPPSSSPPELLTSLPSYAVPATTGAIAPPFPPVTLDSLPPAGLLVGVFSMDSAFERRMLVRTTWASHTRSRDGAGDGDGGAGTSRTIVRFILGQPRREWEARINLEMAMYNDIIVLPVPENMNSGKSWAFFSWAATDGWVPPIYFNTSKPAPRLSYANITSPPPPLSPHDPLYAQREKTRFTPRPWVRPDFVVKVDDDSFVMLAELEARLRLEMHAKGQVRDSSSRVSHSVDVRRDKDEVNANSSNVFLSSMHVQNPDSPHEPRTVSAPPSSHPPSDPLVYWGYLVKNRFMAGELYALSWSLVDWVAKDTIVKGMTKGAEDKQTAKWMRLHPYASDIRWTNERCWIYDHPRAGTVYSHGFLFPSEVTRVRRNIVSYPDKTPQEILGNQPTTWPAPVGANTPTPAAWAHSSVSTFGVRYTPPVAGLSPTQGVEALVEGSDMSVIREGSPMTPEYAWAHREGRQKRYESKRVGGTVVVHFIKKNKWFLETALALLEGDEYSEYERHPWRDSDSESTYSEVYSKPFFKHRHS